LALWISYPPGYFPDMTFAELRPNRKIESFSPIIEKDQIFCNIFRNVGHGKKRNT